MNFLKTIRPTRNYFARLQNETAKRCYYPSLSGLILVISIGVYQSINPLNKTKYSRIEKNKICGIKTLKKLFDSLL